MFVGKVSQKNDKHAARLLESLEYTYSRAYVDQLKKSRRYIFLRGSFILESRALGLIIKEMFILI